MTTAKRGAGRAETSSRSKGRKPSAARSAGNLSAAARQRKNQAARVRRQAAKARRDFFAASESRLNEQREQILDLIRADLGVGRDVSHEGEDDVDRANFESSRELALALSTGEREVLQQIGEALERLEQGAYGSCTHCNRSIAEVRLIAIPWARHCVECQELEERGQLHS